MLCTAHAVLTQTKRLIAHLAARIPQHVRDALRLDGMEALVIQERRAVRHARRILQGRHQRRQRTAVDVAAGISLSSSLARAAKWNSTHRLLSVWRYDEHVRGGGHL